LFKAAFLNELILSFLPSSIVLVQPPDYAPHPNSSPLLDIGVLPVGEFLYNERRTLNGCAREFF
jgi:hypothetical protein